MILPAIVVVIMGLVLLCLNLGDLIDIIYMECGVLKNSHPRAMHSIVCLYIKYNYINYQ